MMTALEPSACITAARFPVWDDARVGVGFLEVSARQSDYAYVSAAAQVALEEDGALLRCAVGIGGATAVPTRLDSVAEALRGRRITPALLREALQPAIAALDIMVDAHASRDYRRRVALRFAEQAIMAACAQAAGKTGGAEA
jgi:carbon-monoxide dehydrogenase medium subunit